MPRVAALNESGWTKGSSIFQVPTLHTRGITGMHTSFPAFPWLRTKYTEIIKNMSSSGCCHDLNQPKPERQYEQLSISSDFIQEEFFFLLVIDVGGIPSFKYDGRVHRRSSDPWSGCRG